MQGAERHTRLGAMTKAQENVREKAGRFFSGFGAPTPEAPPAPVGPTELGRLLCATRMRLSRDLQQIAEVLHIRYNYLVAIEDGRYEDLPGQAYAIGFVRAYADHLGLDGDEVVRRYKEESAGVKHKSAFELPMPAPDSVLPSGTLLLIAVIAGMIVYGVWYAIAGSDRSAVELIQQVPDRLAEITDPNIIEAALPVGAARLPETPGRAPIETGVEGSALLEPAQSVESAVSDGVDVAALPALPETTAPPAAPAPPITDVLEVRAKADVWITLRDPQQVERTQFLRQDEVLRIDGQGVTTLVTANPADVEILVNGRAMPPMDASLFAKGVPLDPQRLRTAPASAVAPVPAPPAPLATTAKPAPAAKTSPPPATSSLASPTQTPSTTAKPAASEPVNDNDAPSASEPAKPVAAKPAPSGADAEPPPAAAAPESSESSAEDGGAESQEATGAAPNANPAQTENRG